MPNELEQFLQDTEQQETNPFAHLDKTPETVEQPEKEPEDDGLKPKNRRERRLSAKLEAERQSNMFLAAKLEAINEAKANLSDEQADYLKAIEQIYGTDTPEAQMATELLKKALVGVSREAEERALKRIQEERQQEQQAVAQAENQLEEILDEIEDTYNVDLTPDQERAYFTLLQKMSPKDKNGEVVSLADPHAVWEVFQDKLSRRPVDNRAKELSARSMTQNGAVKNSDLQEDAGLRLLKEMGVI